MGPTSTANAERFAGNLVRLARQQTDLTQRELSVRSGVPQPVIAAIESGRRQPSWPVLRRILAGADLEPRVRLEAYDDHDDVLDRRVAAHPAVAAAADAVRDQTLIRLSGAS